MKRLSYLVFAILVQVIILLWLMPCARAQQLQIYCDHAHAVACTTAAPGTTVGAQDPAWLISGKSNANLAQLYGMFGAGSSLQTTGILTAPDVRRVVGGVVDATTYGADPTGAADSTNAINAALSTTVHGKLPSVYLPAGNYKITNTLQLSWGQCLYSDAFAPAQLMVDSSFSSSATAVIKGPSSGPSVQWVNWMGTCVHDLTIVGAQPQGFQAVATSATASGATIHVNGTTQPQVGEYVNDDATVFTLIPAGTTVSAVSGSSGAWTVTLSASVTGAGVGSGDTIDFNATRSHYTALGACTSTASNGSGCQYPAFIDTNGLGGHLWNLVLAGAWDGIKVRSWPVWIDNVKAGALDKGLDVDTVTDLMPITRWESHNGFGFNVAGGNANFAFIDGLTIGWNFGRIDGLTANNILLFRSNFVVTNTVNTGDSWDITNMGIDETGQLIVNGNLTDLRLTNFAKNGAPGIASSGCPIQINTGTVHMSQVSFLVQSNSFACIAGGSLYVDGGRADVGNGTSVFFSETSGTLSVRNFWFDKGLQTVAPIQQTGGVIQLINNFDNGNSGPMLSIASDSSFNFIRGNIFSGTLSYPTGTLAGYYEQPGKFLTAMTFAPQTGSTTITAASGANALIVHGSNTDGVLLNNNGTAANNANYLTQNDAGHSLWMGVTGSSSGSAFGNSAVVVGTVSNDSLHLMANTGFVVDIQPDHTMKLLNQFTVAGLPTCNAGEKGAIAIVGDASAPTYGATLVGGAGTAALALCNGSAWVAH